MWGGRRGCRRRAGGAPSRASCRACRAGRGYPYAARRRATVARRCSTPASWATAVHVRCTCGARALHVRWTLYRAYSTLLCTCRARAVARAHCSSATVVAACGMHAVHVQCVRCVHCARLRHAGLPRIPEEVDEAQVVGELAHSAQRLQQRRGVAGHPHESLAALDSVGSASGSGLGAGQFWAGAGARAEAWG